MTLAPPSITAPPTFPAHPFAKLAPSQFLTAHLSAQTTPPTPPTRPSGRHPLQPRPPTIHTGSLTHAHGSAVIRHGDTSIVCGVRGEILLRADIDAVPPTAETDANASDTEDGEEKEEEEIDAAPGPKNPRTRRRRRRRREERDAIARLNLLVPNIDLATGCSPAHLPGGPPSAAAQALTQRLATLLQSADIVALDALRIWGPAVAEEGEEGEGEEKMEVKAFWVLYIDVVVLSLSGAAMDAVWLAVVAALRDTRLPGVRWDAERGDGAVVCEPRGVERGVLREGGRGVPVVLTFGVFEGGGERWVLADMDGFEEGLCGETVVVCVGEGGRVVRIEKGGGGVVMGREIKGLVVEGEKWWRTCMEALGMEAGV